MEEEKGRMTALEVSLEHLTRDVRELAIAVKQQSSDLHTVIKNNDEKFAKALDSLRDIVIESNKPDWSTILGVIALALTILAATVGPSYYFLDKQSEEIRYVRSLLSDK